MPTLIQTLARTLLPARVRRPLADFVYRTLDQYRVTAAWTTRRIRLGSQSPAQQSPQTPARISHFTAAPLLPIQAVKSLARGCLARQLPRLWSQEHPSLPGRASLAVLRLTLSALDIFYQRHFTSLLTAAAPRRPPNPLSARICFAIGTLGPGGAERQMTNILLGLQARGLHPETLVAHLEDDIRSFFAPALRSAHIPVDKLVRGGESLTMLAECGHPDAARLATAIAAGLPPLLHDVALYAREFLLRDPDVVHLWLDEVNVKAGLAAALAGVPRIVLSTRSLNPSHFPLFQPYMRAGYRALTRLSHVVLLNNSEAGARNYEQWIGLAPGTCTVIRNGFDFSRMTVAEPEKARTVARRRFGLPEDAPVIGGVMRLSVEKRPLLWLDVATRVLHDHPDARFLLVGDGVMRDLVVARVAQAPLAARVVLAGHDQRPYDTIPAMDVLFLSSKHEGLPNVLIEAQALGVAVVSMPAGGAPETLDPGQSGWVVPVDDADAAARTVSASIADRDALRRAGEHGRSFVRERFGLERLIDETVSVYGLRESCAGTTIGRN